MWARAVVIGGMLAGCGFHPREVSTADATAGASAADSAPGSIMFDASSRAAIANASSLSWSHTVGANVQNGLLLVGMSIEKQSGAVVQSVTYAGVPLMKASSSTGGSGIRAELWFLTAPPAGANRVTVTLSATVGSDGVIGGAESFAGVDQATPLPTIVNGGDSSGSPSTTISIAHDGSVMADVIVIDNPDTSAPASTQVERWTMAGGITGSASTRMASSTGPSTMSWQSSSDNWAQIVAEIMP